MPTDNPLFMKWFNIHNRFVGSKAGKPFFRWKEKPAKIIRSQRRSWPSAIMTHDYYYYNWLTSGASLWSFLARNIIQISSLKADKKHFLCDDQYFKKNKIHKHLASLMQIY